MILPLIVLRPEPGATATIARATALGLVARSVPLFALEPLPWAAPDPQAYDAVLLTSAAAPRLAGDGLAALSTLPAHCVGAATAAAAAAAGLTVGLLGADNGQSLIDAVGPQRLLWLAGAERSQLIAAPGGAIDAVTVYAARELPVDPHALHGPAVAMVHSPRAGARLANLAADKRHLSLVVISAAAAAACGGGWGGIAVAPSPDDAAMVAIAAELCQSGPGSHPRDQRDER